MMNLIAAFFAAREMNKQTGKAIYVLFDGTTWRACDECDLDTKYPDAPIAYCAHREKKC